MPVVNQSFQSAPLGRRVVIPLIVVGVCVAGAIAIKTLTAMGNLPENSSAAARAAATLAPLMALVIGVPAFLFERSRVSRFAIEENVLVLVKKRYPLEGLVSVERDPRVMRWAIRIMGNGGFGSIRGRFWSKRIGSFHAFLTDTEHAVVLRWPDKVVAVSPSDPESFIYAVREAVRPRR